LAVAASPAIRAWTAGESFIDGTLEEEKRDYGSHYLDFVVGVFIAWFIGWGSTIERLRQREERGGPDRRR
jgi:hypothetical protein